MLRDEIIVKLERDLFHIAHVHQIAKSTMSDILIVGDVSTRLSLLLEYKQTLRANIYESIFLLNGSFLEFCDYLILEHNEIDSVFKMDLCFRKHLKCLIYYYNLASTTIRSIVNQHQTTEPVETKTKAHRKTQQAAELQDKTTACNFEQKSSIRSVAISHLKSSANAKPKNIIDRQLVCEQVVSNQIPIPRYMGRSLYRVNKR